jgi:hypothetical protein
MSVHLSKQGRFCEPCDSTLIPQGYSYAGLEAGTQCFCANWVTYGEWSSGAGAPAGDCDVPCSGNRTETCGGAFRLWTYKLATVSSLPVSGDVGDKQAHPQGCLDESNPEIVL